MYTLLWEYFVNFIEILLFYLFIHLNLQPNHHIINYKHKQLLFLIMKYFTICLLNTFHINEIATMAINSLIGIIYTILFYNNALYLRILWAGIFPILTMLSEYTELLSQYNTYMDKVSKIDEDSLSSADLAYYLDVTNRVNKKLLEVQQ